MAKAAVYTGEVRERGEVTIPKMAREELAWDAGQELQFMPLGQSALLVIPRPLSLEDARREMQRIMRRSGLTAEKLFKGLSESRNEVFTHHYGKAK